MKAAGNDRKPRGELAELSSQLQNLCTAGKRTDKELRTAKKDVFKRVINYMTLGMDMSSLFPMMTSCANLSADDLVLKKMLYLYLTHYATQTPDLALLTINQLQKDFADHDPMIRGLALRSLCSLRVTNFLEYVVTPIMTGLGDRHPYVRRTAVMGVLKVAHIDPASVQQHGMVERVRRLLASDTDVQVIANCLSVLMQLEPPARLVDKALVYTLINRIKEFSDWGQCQVLELASYYRPSSEAEVYDLLNALEDRMGHVNSAVVVATIRVFLHLTLSMTATHQQVLERIREPLKTLISRDDAPTAYAALCHVLLLAQRAPMIFENDAVAFFCRTHDPWYIKKVKMEVLAAIASQSNVYDIVTELTEYARDISPSMAREAVRAVGRIALAVPDSGGIVERLLIFLDSDSEHLVSESLVALKDVLRRYPDVAHVCVGQLGGDGAGGSGGGLAVYGSITEPAARAAYVWMLGQFGGLIQDAPYLLEPFVENWSSEDPTVRLALLTAACQLFFRRPPEAKALLGAALAAGVSDSHSDVRDRSLLYYRLLRADPAAAERVAAPPLMTVPWFSESLTPEARDTIFAEFNSLSVLFQQPSSSFIERSAYHSVEAEPEPATSVAGPPTDLLALEAPELLGADRDTNLLDDTDAVDVGPGAGGQGPGSTGGAGGGGLEADLLSLSLDMPAVAPGPGGPGGAGQGSFMAVPPSHHPQGGPAGPGPGQPRPGQPPYGIPQPMQQGPGGMGGYGGPPQQQWAQGADLLGGLGGGLPQAPLQRPQQPPSPQFSTQAPVPGLGPGQMPMAAPTSNMGTQQQGLQQRPSQPPPSPGNLLGLDDGLGLGLGGGAPVAPPRAQPPPQQPQYQPAPMHQAPAQTPAPPQYQPQAPQPQPQAELSLNPKARVSPAAFQEEWKRLPPAHSATQPVSPATVAAITANNHRDFTQHMTQAYIHTIASGGQAPSFRYYFYGQSAGPSAALYLVELQLRSDAGTLTATVKSADAAGLPAFMELWNTCLTGFLVMG